MKVRTILLSMVLVAGVSLNVSATFFFQPNLPEPPGGNPGKVSQDGGP